MYRYTHLLLTLLIFSATQAHATGSGRPMDGIYLGANLGYSSYEIDGFAETFPPDYDARKRSDLDISDNDPLIRLNAGYGTYWDNGLFTGIEFGYQELIGADDWTVTNTAIGHEVDIEYSSRVDLGLLIGYTLSNDDLLYGRLGYGVTDVNISPYDIGDPSGGAFHDLHGYILGVGYSRMLNEHLGLRIEGNYLSISDSYDNDKNDSEIYDADITDIQLQIGVFYDF